MWLLVLGLSGAAARGDFAYSFLQLPSLLAPAAVCVPLLLAIALRRPTSLSWWSSAMPQDATLACEAAARRKGLLQQLPKPRLVDH
jgi:hypothetical protein